VNWTKLLTSEIDATYHATDGLMKLAAKLPLDWKPATGSNWMTTGQLLQHCTNACGACCKGFVTGDWGMPTDMKPEDMLPTAAKMPSAKNVAAARKLLAADKVVALAMIKKAGEKNLAGKLVGAPWNPEPRPLGQQCLHMVEHLQSHRSQLFYYLKLQGVPVHTGSLWGM
jgi:hypothetical protein